MRKVCLITTIPFTMRAFLLDCAVYLHQSGEFDVTLVCDDDGLLASELPPFLHYIPVRMKRGFDPTGIMTIIRLFKVFRRESFDLVQYSTPNASFYASIAAWLARVPVRVYAQWGLLFVGFTGQKRNLLRLLERITCSLSTAIRPDSSGNLEFSVADGLYPRSKGLVVWNGSADGVNLGVFDISMKAEWRDSTRKRLQIPARALVFGFVGRLTRDKGLNELLGAFRVILNTRMDAFLMLVGDPERLGSLDPELLDWARQERRVIFVGFVADTERYLAAMDVFVLPSYREGFGSVIVEAESMGVPVVATDIPGPRDAVIQNVTGLLVKPMDVDGLRCAMSRLSVDTELRQKMGVKAHQYAVMNFDQNVLMAHVLRDRMQLLGLL